MRRRSGKQHLWLLSLAALLLWAAVPVTAQEVLPRPPQPFKGKIGTMASESTPDFPKEDY